MSLAAILSLSVVAIQSIFADNSIHAVGHGLTYSRAVTLVPTIISSGIYQIFDLPIAVLLGFVAIAVTDIVVVALLLKASESVSHASDTGPKIR